MTYETGRRNIHQLADRLRFQANIWNGNEQEFTDLLPQQLFLWPTGCEGRVVSESRARRRQVRGHIVISKTLLIRRSKKVRMRKPWKLLRTYLPMVLTSI